MKRVWCVFFYEKLMHKSFTLSFTFSESQNIVELFFSINSENRSRNRHVQTIAQVNLLIFSFISKKGSAFRFVTELSLNFHVFTERAIWRYWKQFHKNFFQPFSSLDFKMLKRHSAQYLQKIMVWKWLVRGAGWLDAHFFSSG